MNNHNQSILRRFSSQRTQIHRGPCDEKRSIWLRHTATSFITYHLYWELWAQPRQAQLHQNDPSTSQHQSATLITCSNPPSIRSCWRDAATFLPAKLSATAGSGRNTFGWHTTMGHPSASCVTKLAKSGILLRVAKVDELYWIVTITCVELYHELPEHTCAQINSRWLAVGSQDSSLLATSASGAKPKRSPSRLPRLVTPGLWFFANSNPLHQSSNVVPSSNIHLISLHCKHLTETLYYADFQSVYAMISQHAPGNKRLSASLVSTAQMRLLVVVCSGWPKNACPAASSSSTAATLVSLYHTIY